MWTIIKPCPTLGTTMFLQIIPHSSGQIGQIHGQTRKSVQTCPTLDTTGFIIPNWTNWTNWTKF